MKNLTLEKLNTFAVYLESKISSVFVRKEEGKKLSANDFTNEEKQKLSGIAAEANLTITDSELSDVSENQYKIRLSKRAWMSCRRFFLTIIRTRGYI